MAKYPANSPDTGYPVIKKTGYSEIQQKSISGHQIHSPTLKQSMKKGKMRRREERNKLQKTEIKEKG